MGDAVGRLTAGDDTLRPRLRILADEHLSGPARELVQTRLDLWLKTHIEKLLAPLFSLAAADDVTGMARGVAFQLVEALGVLERQKVSEEVKGLDQPARATLRKYGVRFGAYHIYLPVLLKPAPRALATQLWALKNESPDAKGVAELLHLAASGRTSIPVEAETPKALYRSAGYRACGERAVRVDILERLADLIRPALSWREGVSASKPDGAFDGRSFTVTGAMTSLTGASGEDFAGILRALGYRMDRRPKPPESKPPESTPPEPKPTESPETTPTEVQPSEPLAEVPAEAAVDAVAETPAETPADTAGQPAAEPAVEATAEPPVEAAQPAAESESASAAPEEAAATVAAAEEPALIEVWRPAGRPERRPHHRPRRPRQTAAAPAPAEAATAAEAGGSARPSPARQHPERPPRHERKQRFEQKDQQEKPRSKRQDRHQDRHQGSHQDRQDRRPRRRRDDGPDRAERERYYAKPRGGERADKTPDPNSPFAKLAALKAQLEQGDKERP
jgi:ATP-dependent RNA helicase SUPV3L1/SUV3